MPSHHIRIIEIFATILVCAAFLRWSYRRNHSECKGNAYEFDPGRIPGAFEPHAKRYQALAKLVLTLAAASAAFLLSFFANIDVSKPRNDYSIRLEYVAPSAMVFLCLSAGSRLIFLLLQTFITSSTPMSCIPPRKVSQQSRRPIQTSVMQPS